MSNGLRAYGTRKTTSYRPVEGSATRRINPTGNTWTDLFCGGGGSSTGIVRTADAEVIVAANHWQLAVDTHATNHPRTEHVCADISATDPRHFPRTRNLWASPECTFHSFANGQRKPTTQQSLFTEWNPQEPQQAERSRATMWDVVRFAEYHRYEYIIVENVVEVLKWTLFNAWWRTITEDLGYVGQKVFLNSMFCPPTPQSRDRLYMVFSRTGAPVPDTRITPPAWCVACDQMVAAVQSWKPGRSAGKYKQQYLYCCPQCARAVTPSFYPAYTAIDWTQPIERIGDRKHPLKPKTMQRIQAGLEKFGRQPLVFVANHRGAGNVHTALRHPLPTQTGGATLGFVYSDGAWDNTYRGIGEELPTATSSRTFNLVEVPWIAEVGHGGPENASRNRAISEALPTVHTLGGSALVIAPYIVPQSYGTGDGHTAYPASEPLHAQTSRQDQGLLLAPLQPFLVVNRSHSDAGAMTDALPTIVAGGMHHALALAPLAPYSSLIEYNGTSDQPHSMAEPIGTITSVLRHGLVQPSEAVLAESADEAPLPDIEECYYRTLKAHEIKAGMGFPSEYVLLGASREQVKQAGNAVTPPAAQLLAERCVSASIHTTPVQRVD